MRPELAGDRRVRALFLREETALRAVDHPGVVSYRDLVVEGGTLALLMDFVDGPDLRRHLTDRGGRLSPSEAAAILAQVAAALDAAHAQGVVHLDLKPENLLLVRGSNPPEVRVTDFGVAALLMDADRGAAGGTPGYTAPEIWQGTPPTPAADVYSLGVLLVELVTGDLQGDPESLPVELAGPARSCLAPDPAQRPTARKVAAYLRALVTASALPAPRPSSGPAAESAEPSRLTTVRKPVGAGGPWAGAFAGAAQHPAAAESGTDHLGLWAGQLAGAPAPINGRSSAGTPLRTASTSPASEPPQTPPGRRARRWRGPLVTLGVVLAVAGALIGVNIATAADRRADRQNAATIEASSPAATPTAGQGVALPTEPVRTGPATSAPAPVRITLAGHVADDAGTLAISIRDQIAIAYICDGTKVEAWLKGTAKNGTLSLTGKNGSKIVGTFDRDSAEGRVTVIGKTHDFKLGTVKKPSGLYRTSAKVRNAQVKGSWIVLPDGRQVGVITAGGKVGPAPALDVANRTTTVDGAPVAVTAIDVDSGAGF